MSATAICELPMREHRNRDVHIVAFLIVIDDAVLWQIRVARQMKTPRAGTPKKSSTIVKHQAIQAHAAPEGNPIKP